MHTKNKRFAISDTVRRGTTSLPATAQFSDRGFQYRGVIISNSDLTAIGQQAAKSSHRNDTRLDRTDLIGKYLYFLTAARTIRISPQPSLRGSSVTINADGTINQVEITTQGVGAPLPAAGEYSAALCCNLYNRRTKCSRNGKETGSPTSRRETAKAL